MTPRELASSDLTDPHQVVAQPVPWVWPVVSGEPTRNG